MKSRPRGLVSPCRLVVIRYTMTFKKIRKTSLPRGITKSYTQRMKTAISIPDDLFAQAESAADRLGMSRSELFGRAIAHFLKLHDEDAVTQAMNQAWDGLEESAESSKFRRAAARQIAERDEW